MSQCFKISSNFQVDMQTMLRQTYLLDGLPAHWFVCLFQKREAFCQLLQLMKNKHSNQDEPDMISLFIGTWNMGQTPSYVLQH